MAGPKSDIPKKFEGNRYVVVENFLPRLAAKLAARYARARSKSRPQQRDTEFPGTHAVYADRLMETLLTLFPPRMENVSGKSLWPTYSYYRVYKPGDVLRPHRDRLSCEISASVCLGYGAGAAAPGYVWKFWANNRPLANGGQKDPAGDRGYELTPGQAVVYRGCEVEHWRDAFEGEWHRRSYFFTTWTARANTPTCASSIAGRRLACLRRRESRSESMRPTDSTRPTNGSWEPVPRRA